jgi:hypothetical protein
MTISKYHEVFNFQPLTVFIVSGSAATITDYRPACYGFNMR